MISFQVWNIKSLSNQYSMLLMCPIFLQKKKRKYEYNKTENIVQSLGCAKAESQISNAKHCEC